MQLFQNINPDHLNFIFSIIASILATLIYVNWEKWFQRIPTFGKFGNTLINGFWIGKIKSTHREGQPAYNIFKISERKGSVVVYIEHYKELAPQAYKLHGIGIFNSPQLSIAYQFPKKNLNQSGVLAARLRNSSIDTHELLATYVQFIEVINENKHYEIKPIKMEYIISKIDLPLKIQIKALFLRFYFGSYKEVEKFYNTLFLNTDKKE